jgi:nickel transport protein
MTPLSFVPRLSLAAAVLLLLSVASPAYAHRVNIFAWVEGNTVHTESKFSDGRMVQGGEVVVEDPQGKVLLTGKTDTKGTFSFPVPAVRTDLKVVINASMGHRGEWTLTAAELVAAAEPVPEAAAAAPAVESGSAPAAAAPVPSSAGPSVSSAEMERIVDAALERRLQPIRQALAEMQGEKIGFREVMGGLGYIFGLMGIAAYFRFRKDKGRG